MSRCWHRRSSDPAPHPGTGSLSPPRRARLCAGGAVALFLLGCAASGDPAPASIAGLDQPGHTVGAVLSTTEPDAVAASAGQPDGAYVPASAAAGPDPAPTPGEACGIRDVTVMALSGSIEGLSTLAPAGDGAGFVALSDRGDIYYLTIRDGEAGVTPLGRLHDLESRSVPTNIDSEGLALLPDGRWVVAFERYHRLEIYAPGIDGLVDGAPDIVAVPPNWLGLAPNRGVETIAMDAAGDLIAIEEGSPLSLGVMTAWRLSPTGDAAEVAYRTGWGVFPTDAAVLPTGEVFVLERVLTGNGGLGARIVRLAVDGDGGLRGDVVVSLVGVIPPANYEGLAATRLADGGIRFLVLSDEDRRSDTVLAEVVIGPCP